LSPTLNNVDRRVAARFPIEREIRYKLLIHKDSNEEGTGKSINISSGGILFTTDCHLQPGIGIEVTISWPVLMDAEVSMRLVTRGQVVRSADGRVAMKIYRYEFRNAQADASSSQLYWR
jgi:c-di-GMP-binding flagellar brake protein YcgR